MFLEVTDKLNNKKKMINGAYIYSVTPKENGNGAIVKYGEGTDRAKMIQTVESYEALWRVMFPVVPEHRDTVDEYFNADISSLMEVTQAADEDS